MFKTVFGPPNGNSSPETIATVRKKENALLIAAAPDLLDSVHYIDYAIGGEENEEYADDEILEIRITGKAIKDLKAAILKAEGRKS